MVITITFRGRRYIRPTPIQPLFSRIFYPPTALDEGKPYPPRIVALARFVADDDNNNTANAPAVAVFLLATPPAGNGLGHLISPRNRGTECNKSITPPIQPRPTGFWHDATAFFLEPQQQQQPPNSRSLESDLVCRPTTTTERRQGHGNQRP